MIAMVAMDSHLDLAFEQACRAGLSGITLVTIIGLFKLNNSEPGITATFKGLWEKKEKKIEKMIQVDVVILSHRCVAVP